MQDETTPQRNGWIAGRFRQAADLLEAQGANPFRVRAYREGADSIERLQTDIGDLYAEGGIEALEALEHIGASLAAAIAEMVRSGRWAQLERMRGESAPEELFRTLPGIGPALARRIHDALDVDTLEALEAAAHDGRLEAVAGVGRRRTGMLRAALAERLARMRPRRQGGVVAEPPVELLLDVDCEYRERAGCDDLPTIAPRRFNPAGRSWLPILHTRRGDWELTALYSNTARAHDLKRVFDWVVIWFHSDREPEGQRTVVTETRGVMAGRRVVRGREEECRAFHRTGCRTDT